MHLLWLQAELYSISQSHRDRKKKKKKNLRHPFCMFQPNILNFHTRLLTIISQSIKTYFSFPDILQNLLIFQNQIFKRYTHLKN
ncbi:hypothetical protein LDENG_00181930 [Lucifuga dentata]|nr:hypothetical protein LDENG_00181930 [Lucifuga dentata]